MNVSVGNGAAVAVTEGLGVAVGCTVLVGTEMFVIVGVLAVAKWVPLAAVTGGWVIVFDLQAENEHRIVKSIKI